MPQERLAKQALLAKANGRSPVGQPRTRWTDWFEDLGWNRLGFHPSEIMNVMEDREMSQESSADLTEKRAVKNEEEVCNHTNYEIRHSCKK